MSSRRIHPVIAIILILALLVALGYFFVWLRGFQPSSSLELQAGKALTDLRNTGEKLKRTEKDLALALAQADAEKQISDALLKDIAGLREKLRRPRVPPVDLDDCRLKLSMAYTDIEGWIRIDAQNQEVIGMKDKTITGLSESITEASQVIQETGARLEGFRVTLDRVNRARYFHLGPLRFQWKHIAFALAAGFTSYIIVK